MCARDGRCTCSLCKNGKLESVRIWMWGYRCGGGRVGVWRDAGVEVEVEVCMEGCRCEGEVWRDAGVKCGRVQVWKWESGGCRLASFPGPARSSLAV